MAAEPFDSHTRIQALVDQSKPNFNILPKHFEQVLRSIILSIQATDEEKEKEINDTVREKANPSGKAADVLTALEQLATDNTNIEEVTVDETGATTDISKFLPNFQKIHFP